MYKNSREFGKMYGLEASDLTDEQLKKVEFNKLMECSVLDDRAVKIVGDQLDNAGLEQISRLDNYDKEDYEKIQYVIDKYNEVINTNGDKLEKEANKSYYYGRRSRYIFWDMLNEQNKLIEVVRWHGALSSVVSPRTIDFEWLCKAAPELAETTIEKILDQHDHQSKINLIRQVPKEFGLKYIDKIFEQHPSLYVHMLSNTYTPRNYVIKALRGIAGRKRIPRIIATLDKSILEALPSVTRLKVLESLCIYSGSKITFTDINCREDLEPLLFSTSMKYNERVSAVIRYFNYK